MLFVPMYERSIGKKRKIMVIKKNDMVVFFIDSHGEIDRCGAIHLERNYKPITLECPYCGATLNQSERVECGCGWSAEAISEAQREQWLSISQEGYTENEKVAIITEPADEVMGKGFEMVYKNIYDINGIHFLETKRGESE